MIEKRPLCAVTISFILGICAFSSQNIITLTICALATLAGALFVAFLRKRWIIALSLITAFAISGVLTTHEYEKFKSQPIYPYEKVGIYGTVINVREKDDIIELLLHVKKINEENVDYKIIMYTLNMGQDYKFGDNLYTIKQLTEPEKARFDGDRDFELEALSNRYRAWTFVDPSTITIFGNSAGKFSVGKLAFNIRQYIKQTLNEFFPREEADLAIGLTLGDTYAMSDELYESMKHSGLLHVTALSGLNVNIIMLAILFLVKRISLKRIAVNLIICAFLIAFVMIVDYSPSIARAIIMAIFGISATFFWRRNEIFTNLAFAALAILISNPYALYNVSFQLSFVAVIGLAVYITPIPTHNMNAAKSVFLALGVSVACLLTTATLSAQYFGKINLTSIWVGVLVVPLTNIALIGSYIVCIINIISPTLATIFSFSNIVLLHISNSIIKLSAEHAVVSISANKFSWSQIAIYFSFLYLIYCIEERVVQICQLEKRS